MVFCVFSNGILWYSMVHVVFKPTWLKFNGTSIRAIHWSSRMQFLLSVSWVWVAIERIEKDLSLNPYCATVACSDMCTKKCCVASTVRWLANDWRIVREQSQQITHPHWHILHRQPKSFLRCPWSKILRLLAKIWAFKQRLRMLTPLAVIQLRVLCWRRRCERPQLILHCHAATEVALTSRIQSPDQTFTPW